MNVSTHSIVRSFRLFRSFARLSADWVNGDCDRGKSVRETKEWERERKKEREWEQKQNNLISFIYPQRTCKVANALRSIWTAPNIFSNQRIVVTLLRTTVEMVSLPLLLLSSTPLLPSSVSDHDDISTPSENIINSFQTMMIIIVKVDILCHLLSPNHPHPYSAVWWW